MAVLSYRTVRESGSSEIIVKNSRFIATVLPAATKAAALDSIEDIRRRYRKAQHNVFAFTVGTENMITQCSDDGEPAGTAGPVVLEMLRKVALLNTVIIVTRYYGGTLLGAGGLIRAYGRAAKLGIAAAEIIRNVRHQAHSLEFAYPFLGQIGNYLRNRSYPIVAVNYTARVEMDVLVPAARAHEFRTEIDELTGGQIKIGAQGVVYLACPDGIE
jgi:uncharacterized YigZ family protein